MLLCVDIGTRRAMKSRSSRPHIMYKDKKKNRRHGYPAYKKCYSLQQSSHLLLTTGLWAGRMSDAVKINSQVKAFAVHGMMVVTSHKTTRKHRNIICEPLLMRWTGLHLQNVCNLQVAKTGVKNYPGVFFCASQNQQLQQTIQYTLQ